jgi:hypothetical protein
VLADFFEQVLPVGITGSVIATLIAVLCLVAVVRFFGEAVKRFTSSRDDETVSSLAAINYWGRPAVSGIILSGLSVASVTFALKQYPNNLPWIFAYILVGCFGGAVGAAELVSRYRDNPTRALWTVPGFFYILLNACGSLAALYLIYVFRETLGFADGEHWRADPITLVKAVLLAGFSSLLFFRTSVFKLKAGNSELAIGPSIVLDTLLGAADRAVDRAMASPRADFVHRVMSDISFEKAATILPSHSVALMQNVTNEESQRIAGVVNELRSDKDMPDKIKSLNLGLELLSVVGANVLETAVKSLKRDLQSDRQANADLVRDATAVMRKIAFESARSMLPSYVLALWPSEISKEALQKLSLDLKALSEMWDVVDEFKSLILGIRLARLTDVVTLQKAVEDLANAITIQPEMGGAVPSSSSAGVAPPNASSAPQASAESGE